MEITNFRKERKKASREDANMGDRVCSERSHRLETVLLCVGQLNVSGWPLTAQHEAQDPEEGRKP